MNFLAHHKTLHRYDDPTYCLGKVLPDLLRGYNADWRVTTADLALLPESAPLTQGIGVHLHTDKYFHNSSYFTSVVQQNAALFRQVEWPSQFRHGWFFAHVVSEMLLDRVILRQEKWLADDFYIQLSAVNKATLQALFRYKGWNTAMNGFWDYLQRFVQSRYLFTYEDDSHLLYALNRVGNRVGLSLFGEPHRTALVHMLPKMEQIVATGHSAIFETIENELSS